MNKYFSREGSEVSEKNLSNAHFTSEDSGYYIEHFVCSKCGGAGGHDVWRFTGYTCYRCNASTSRINGKFSDPSSPRKVAIYSEEKLAKMNATAKKRAAAKYAKAEAKAKADFENMYSVYGEIYDTAEYYAQFNSFVGKVLETIKSTNNMSEKQEALLISLFEKTQKEIEKKKTQENAFQGEIGERIQRDLTCYHKMVFEGNYGPFYITLHHDDKGNTYVYKGSSPPVAEKSTETVKFTVKSHEEYKGVNQTIISRPKNIS